MYIMTHSQEEKSMTDQEQVKRIKCPHCGWIRRITIPIEGEMMADAIQGIRERVSETLKDAITHIKAMMADPELQAANAWLDMPACPHCGNVYRYNVRTGEVTK
jgi:predicted RNA-binding Zn-ribbon protein involved in translation (DUF1610 family)